VRAPKGGARNNAHHAQEVMNGTQNDGLPQHRAIWFWTLNVGQLKTGTANSDSHGLTDNTVGVPRSVVYTDTLAGPSFDVGRFNLAIREGRVLGTNGPVIEATVDGTSGPTAYGLAPFQPAANAQVHVRVSAAPWVPVQEVRFIVNGATVKRVPSSELAHPVDPFGEAGLVRYEADVPLSTLVSGTADAWLVIEAGAELPENADLGGGFATKEHPDGAPDGVPDTGDNNGDGTIDLADIADGETVGPLATPPLPTAPDDVAFHFSQVIGRGYPFAFTNPFILDRNGNQSFEAPGVGQ
jgi:hypothetical protein